MTFTNWDAPGAEPTVATGLIAERRMDREYWALIVLDDRDERDRSSIYALVRNIPRIKLVSIDHGPDDSSRMQYARQRRSGI